MTLDGRIRITRAILRKEYRHIFRDPRSLIAAFAIPMILLMLFGYAIDFDVKHVDVGVWDEDRSQESRDLLGHLFGSGTLVHELDVSSEEEADRALVRGDVKVIVHVPPRFARDLARGDGAKVQAIVDGTSGPFAGLALAYVQGSVARYGTSLATTQLAAAGLSDLRDHVPPLAIRPRTWFNESLESRQFTIPGLIAIIVMMLAAQLTSQCVAREFERGTIEPLIASPMAPWQLVAGKLIPYVTIGLGQITLVTLLALFWFRVPFRGSFLLFAFASGMFLVGSMSIGLLLSIVTRSQQIAQQLALLMTMLPSLLISGFIFPIRSMPYFLQVVSLIVPARYYLSIVRGVMLRGAGWGAMSTDLLFMAGFMVAITAACVTRFKKRLA